MNDVSAQATCSAMLLLKSYDFNHTGGNINCHQPPQITNSYSDRKLHHTAAVEEDVARWKHNVDLHEGGGNGVYICGLGSKSSFIMYYNMLYRMCARHATFSGPKGALIKYKDGESAVLGGEGGVQRAHTHSEKDIQE
ncbi:hypothetical protein NQZ68_019144 [Dissostichus eleginoides]|nr:hypothetical protein NQZ68_019144 [Dissostichus eleginoides]